MWRDRGFGHLLGLLALCLVLGDNLLTLVDAHGQLGKALVGQTGNDAAIAKVDAQLDALARGTQRLADGGNLNARKIVAQLAQAGVRINANASPPPKP